MRVYGYLYFPWQPTLRFFIFPSAFLASFLHNRWNIFDNAFVSLWRKALHTSTKRGNWLIIQCLIWTIFDKIHFNFTVTHSSIALREKTVKNWITVTHSPLWPSNPSFHVWSMKWPSQPCVLSSCGFNWSKIHSTLNTGNRFWFTNMFVFLIIFTSTTIPHLWPWQDDYHKQCIAASISNLGDLRNWWKIWERTSGISERFLCSFADPSVWKCCQCVPVLSVCGSVWQCVPVCGSVWRCMA